MKSNSDKLHVTGHSEAAVIYALHQHLDIPVGSSRKSRTVTRAAGHTMDYLSAAYPTRGLPMGLAIEGVKSRVYKKVRAKMFGSLGGLLLGWLIKQIVWLVVDWYFR